MNPSLRARTSTCPRGTSSGVARLAASTGAAVSKVQDCLDTDFDLDDGPVAQAAVAPACSFAVEQLEAMLAQARAQQAMA